MQRRKDGRDARTLRKLGMELNGLSRADGSSKFAFGSTAVMAAVSGPMEVRIKEEKVDRATLQVHVRPLRGLPTLACRAEEAYLAKLYEAVVLLEEAPRSLVQLTVQTTAHPSTAFLHTFSTATGDDALPPPKKRKRAGELSPTEKAAAVNASTLALMGAGVALKGMVLAVPMALSKERQLLLDPTVEEEEQALGGLTIAVAFGTGYGGAGECVRVDAEGVIDHDTLFEALELAQTAAKQIQDHVRRELEKPYGIERTPPDGDAEMATEDP